MVKSGCCSGFQASVGSYNSSVKFYVQNRLFSRNIIYASSGNYIRYNFCIINMLYGTRTYSEIHKRPATIRGTHFLTFKPTTIIDKHVCLLGSILVIVMHT